MVDRHKLFIITLLLAVFLGYSFFLYSALPAKNQQDQEADSGKLTWQKYNCNACHQIFGLGGYLGPDITNVYSEKGAVYIRAFLKTGSAIMPDFHLSEKEMNDLISFMKAVDASGKSDPKTFILHENGTIEQQ